MSCQPSTNKFCGFRIRRSIAIRLAVCGLLGLHAVMVGWMAWRYSPTIDEPAHLVAGLSHWKFGRFELYRVNPPLVRLVASLPMLIVDPKTDWSGFNEAPYARSEFLIGTRFTNTNGFETFWHFTLARWACIPFSLIGGCFCYLWARDLYGKCSGVTALVIWAFCPSILGNGALITPDVGAGALGIAAGYCFWRWLRRPDWTRALVAGLTLGLAELTKTTWILLFGLWPLLWLLWRFDSWRTGSESPLVDAGTSETNSSQCERVSSKSAISFRISTILRGSGGAGQLSAILLLALYFINLGYAFESSFQRLDRFQFVSHVLGGPDSHRTPGNRFAGTWIGTLPVPLPANFVLGIDVQRYDFERGKWSYLRGEQRMGGWWYYYLYAMAVKMPLGTLFLIALTAMLSAARTIGTLRKPTDAAFGCVPRLNDLNDPRSSFFDEVVLLAPALALLIVVSSQTGFNRYMRYVLPVFPFIFIWVSQVAWLFGARRMRMDQFSWNRDPPPAAPGRSPLQYLRSAILDPRSSIFTSAIVLLALVASTLSSLAVFPHSLSYFNELAGGPNAGPTHLLDANIDWGQDLLELKRWYHNHHESRPLHVAYFGDGFLDPRIAGIVYEPVARWNPETDRFDVDAGPQPGWYAVSVSELHGYKHLGDRADDYAWLRRYQPCASAGYSIRIFHVTSD